MNKRKLSVKNFIEDFQNHNVEFEELEEANGENSSNTNIFDINDLILDKSESNLERYNKLKNILDSCSSCQLSDAFNTVTNRSCVIKGLKSINYKKAYGKVFTAETTSNDWGTSILAVDYADNGDFLLINSKGENSAIWGELASTYAENNGIVGVAIYGDSRDVDAVLNLDFPVFSVDTVPNAGSPLGEGKLNIDLQIENINISPGDFIFGDENGVVIIPKDLFAPVISQTYQIIIKESEIKDEIKNGKLLSEIVSLK